MKNNKILIVLLLLVLNSCIKAMDFDELAIDQQEESTSSITFTERIAYAAAVASAYREDLQEETKTTSESSYIDENSSTCKRQKTSHASSDKVMDFYGFLEDDNDTNKIGFDSIKFETSPYLYELSQKELLRDKLDVSTKELIQKDSVSHNSTSLTEKTPQRKNKNKEYECAYDNCDKSFKYKSNLNQHINSVHKSKRYTCTNDNCTKSFTSASDFKRHIKSVHKGKRYSCTYDGCNKSFTTDSYLKIHRESAHEGKRYSCTHDGCNKSFTTAGSLKTHKKSVHEGKRYECTHDGCDKSFTQAGNLKTHVESAHEGKRYTCTYDGCSQSFIQVGDFKRHIKSKHESNGESNEK